MNLQIKPSLYTTSLILFFTFLISCGSSGNTPNPDPKDTTAPRIISLNPSNNSSSIDLARPATVTFSEAIKKETITDSNITLTAKNGGPIDKTLVLSADNKTLTITYKGLTTNPETITITLTGITDPAGNPLQSTTWKYTTPTWISLSDALDVEKTHFTFEPAMATDNDGHVVIAWYEQDPVSNQNRIYIKRWNGSSWEQLGTALNTAPDSSADYPSLVIDYENRPVLAWHETDASFNNSINIKRWTGTTWEQMGGGHGGTTVTVDEGEFPSLAITSDNVPVVAYAKSADIFVRFWNGSSWVNWDAAGALDDIATQNASRPSLVLLGDTNPIPFVAFEEIENSSQPSSNIYVKYYDAAAFTWKDIDEINDELDIDVAKDASHPVLSLASGLPMVAWEESNGVDRDIHVKRLNGSVWEDIGNDDFGSQDSSEAHLLQDYKFGEQPFTYPAVVWRGSDISTGQNVYLKIYNDTTGLWETPTIPLQPINTLSAGSEHPVITIDKYFRPVVAFAEFDSVSNSQNLHVKVLNRAITP
jgi:hypothetical protein